VEEDSDQNTNDLDKALQLIRSRRDEIWSGDCSNKRVCVYGAFGGRFDQEMGCIQGLFNWSETFDHKLFLFDDNTCAFLLPEVITNEIRLPFYGEAPANQQESMSDDLVGEGPTCGLIPIGHRCEFVHTTGLKWDLGGSALEFGGMVSTSNRAMEEVITVQTSHPLVFTAEITSGKVRE
jgi:thiamine pyrophosphokinase